jgi:hypothetical protein
MGYKLSHKSSHLCYVFFEKDAFTVTIQIGDAYASALENILPFLSSKAQIIGKNDIRAKNAEAGYITEC